MKIVDRIMGLFPELKSLPKKQKCKYCDNQATKRIIHSEGRAYIPVCPKHLEMGKKQASRSTPDKRADPSNIDRVDEIKSGIRYVRDAEYWGVPEWTPITPGMKPKGKKAPNVPKVAAKKRTPAKPSRVQKQKQVVEPATPAKKPPAKQRALALHKDTVANTTSDGRLRAWGPEDANQAVRRANVGKNKDEQIAYVKPAELNLARKTAVERARKKTPEPSYYDIRDNKRLQEAGGVGSSTDTDNLRGNSEARKRNSWAVYIAFGGYDEKTGKDKGYVPCVGCGVKTSWHTESKFPKFEQDKIVVGRYGGSYNPQNIVPMCAGCNNQRGNKLFHESPAFAGGKPTWFTRSWQKWADEVEAAKRKELRPNGGKGVDKDGIPHGRPAKETPNTPMPVVPKRSQTKSEGWLLMSRKDQIIARAKSLSPGQDGVQNEPVSGDRVEANLFNFDGRHNDGDNIWPPDVDDPTAQVVGTLLVESVKSAFGDYERMTVIADDGAVSFVEPATVRVIAEGIREEEKSHTISVEVRADILELKLAGGSNGPATGASNALNKYWTSGAGLARWANTPTPYRSLVAALGKEGVPAHMIHGLAAKYYKKVKGTWPGKRGGKK